MFMHLNEWCVALGILTLSLHFVDNDRNMMRRSLGYPGVLFFIGSIVQLDVSREMIYFT